jgi:hypothetical protein
MIGTNRYISGSKVGIVGVYQTHDYADEKREALNSWAQHVMDIVGPPQSD